MKSTINMDILKNQTVGKVKDHYSELSEIIDFIEDRSGTYLSNREMILDAVMYGFFAGYIVRKQDERENQRETAEG